MIRFFQRMQAVIGRLGIILVAVLAMLRPSQAHAATYYYFGPAWNLSQCSHQAGCNVSNCINGNITGSVNFPGVSDSYSGTILYSSVGAWDLEATGIATLGPGNYLITSTKFVLSSGQIGSWNFSGSDSLGHNPIIESIGPTPGDYDAAAVGSTTPYTSCGFVQLGTPGQWIGPKQLGRPISYEPQASEAVA